MQNVNDIIDGYYDEHSFSEFTENQIKLNARLKEISDEISNLPTPPRSIDKWIESWSDLNSNNFTMSSYAKHSKIRREYKDLIESSENNLRKMRIIAIDDIIAKIKKI